MIILPVHIVIALSSLVYGSFAVINPSRRKLFTNLALIAATLVSGTVLVVQAHSPLLQSCVSGLAYVSIMAALSAASYRRLARQEVSID